MAASKEPAELLVVANDEFARRLSLVGLDDWRRPTPSAKWDVRALVNHVVGGCVRHQMLLRGAQTQEVEATRALDHLGAEPVAAFAAAADVVVSCFCEDGALERVVHHAAGELLSMRVLDSAVHSWDLARAVGAEETLDDEVVAFLVAYTAGLDLGPRSARSHRRTPMFRATRHHRISCSTGWGAIRPSTRRSRGRHQAVPRRDDAAHQQGGDGAA